MTLRVRPEANEELTEALAWLIRNQRPGVAANLWAMWQTGTDAIELDPRRYPPAEDSPEGLEVRNYILPRYGYRIVYAVLGFEIVILAFARGRRRAGHWIDRASEP